MCWGCRPTCDNCKPPLYFYVSCPSCDYPHKVTREEYLLLMNYPHRRSAEEKDKTPEQIIQGLVCTHCGCDLSGNVKGCIEPKPCIQSNVLCGYPCGQRNQVYDIHAKRCEKMVPLKRLTVVQP